MWSTLIKPGRLADPSACNAGNFWYDSRTILMVWFQVNQHTVIGKEGYLLVYVLTSTRQQRQASGRTHTASPCRSTVQARPSMPATCGAHKTARMHCSTQAQLPVHNMSLRQPSQHVFIPSTEDQTHPHTCTTRVQPEDDAHHASDGPGIASDTSDAPSSAPSSRPVRTCVP